jgi:galactose-1-phosphate uridylyltransferase
VVPNLYPALERQEVVVHTPRHARSFAELEESEVQAVASALDARRQTARAEGFMYVQFVLNEGRQAGASLPHSHSQLFWLRDPPPAVQEELAVVGRVTCSARKASRSPFEETALCSRRQRAERPTSR